MIAAHICIGAARRHVQSAASNPASANTRATIPAGTGADHHGIVLAAQFVDARFSRRRATIGCSRFGADRNRPSPRHTIRIAAVIRIGGVIC
jgi:hypothetical protein